MNNLPVQIQTIDHSNLVEEFLRGRTPQTLRAYQQDMESFSQYLGSHDSNEASRVLLSCDAGKANQVVLSFRNHLKESGLQHSSINRRLSTLRSLVKLARTLGLVTWSIEIQNLKTSPSKDTRGPRESGFTKLMSQVQYRTDPKGVRDHCILLLLHDLGLRRGEVCSLDLDDIDLENKTVMVLGKGRDSKQTLTLPERTRDALKQWIQVRGNGPGALFTNMHHNPDVRGMRLTGKGTYLVINRIGKDTGQGVTPHSIRHCAITTAVERACQEGLDVSKVLQFSRHKNLQTLQVYIDNHEDFQGRIASWVAR